MGDMLELGTLGEALHGRMGELAAARGVSLLLTEGEISRATHEAAQKAGLTSAVHYESRGDLIAALPELIMPGDCVLVKASNSRKFSEIVEALERL